MHLRSLLLLLVFALSACTAGSSEPVSCSEVDSANPTGESQRWNGVSYELPLCWTATESDSGESLTLQHGDLDTRVVLSFEDLPKMGEEISFELPDGRLLHLGTNNSQSREVDLIFASLGIGTVD